MGKFLTSKINKTKNTYILINSDFLPIVNYFKIFKICLETYAS